jgi:hypothetical protein
MRRHVNTKWTPAYIKSYTLASKEDKKINKHDKTREGGEILITEKWINT